MHSYKFIDGPTRKETHGENNNKKAGLDEYDGHGDAGLFLGAQRRKKSNNTKKPEQSSNNLHKQLFTHLPYGPD
jgi:hypothetical protein